MKDPRRLLDGDGSEEQRALLRAGQLEEPPPEGQARLLAALGVAAPGGGGAPSTGDAGASSTLAAGGSVVSAGKLVVLAVGSAALLGAGVMLWQAGKSANTSASAGAATSATTSASATTSTSTTTGKSTGVSPGGAQAEGVVALEIEALERVRSQLVRKDGQAALAALQRYSSRHPHGVLAHEAEVLRVEALWLEGETAAALELAEQLLRRHGDSPHRARLEALARQARAASPP